MDARPLITDYMGQFEHDQQWENNSMGETGEVFGEYTPFNFLEWCTDVEDFCKHEFNRTINAPMQEVHEFFTDWKKIPLAFDLIDTIVPDGLEEDVAQVMTFYRWRKTPLLQILMSLRRQSVDGDTISFSSDDGMPFVALVRLYPADKDPENSTEIIVNVEYALPTILKEFVGKFGIQVHLDSILSQNLLVRLGFILKSYKWLSLQAFFSSSNYCLGR